MQVSLGFTTLPTRIVKFVRSSYQGLCIDIILQSYLYNDRCRRSDPSILRLGKWIKINYFVGAGLKFTDQDLKSLFGMAYRHRRLIECFQ